LAQEVEKVFKEAVSTDKDGNKTVKYSALLAPIIEAIHELNSLIDDHYESKFNAQVKRIERIEQKLVK
jgi:trimeric autotransporter adhesin